VPRIEVGREVAVVRVAVTVVEVAVMPVASWCAWPKRGEETGDDGGDCGTRKEATGLWRRQLGWGKMREASRMSDGNPVTAKCRIRSSDC
jgi:hypothetical protein